MDYAGQLTHVSEMRWHRKGFEVLYHSLRTSLHVCEGGRAGYNYYDCNDYIIIN